MSKRLVTLKGTTQLTLGGDALAVGAPFPACLLTGSDMSDLSTTTYRGKVVIVATVPSLDTPVCSIETKRFNQEAQGLAPHGVVLTVSRDLPFAQKRWCGAEGAESVVVASDYKYRTFGDLTGTTIQEWALLCRAVFVVDKGGVVAYAEYVAEVSNEPNYEAALQVARTLV